MRDGPGTHLGDQYPLRPTRIFHKLRLPTPCPSIDYPALCTEHQRRLRQEICVGGGALEARRECERPGEMCGSVLPACHQMQRSRRIHIVGLYQDKRGKSGDSEKGHMEGRLGSPRMPRKWGVPSSNRTARESSIKWRGLNESGCAIPSLRASGSSPRLLPSPRSTQKGLSAAAASTVPPPQYLIVIYGDANIHKESYNKVVDERWPATCLPSLHPRRGVSSHYESPEPRGVPKDFVERQTHEIWPQ
jgi:hypothetical protein